MPGNAAHCIAHGGMIMTPSEAAVFSAIAGSLFWQPKADDEPAIGYLLTASLIQTIHQGKLNGYALTPAGYVRWMGLAWLGETR